jgi:hypothetical protein
MMLEVDENKTRGAGKTGNASAPQTTPDEATVAAISLALELESQPEASRIAVDRGPSSWALAGRARVLRGR